MPTGVRVRLRGWLDVHVDVPLRGCVRLDLYTTAGGRVGGLQPGRGGLCPAWLAGSGATAARPAAWLALPSSLAPRPPAPCRHAQQPLQQHRPGSGHAPLAERRQQRPRRPVRCARAAGARVRVCSAAPQLPGGVLARARQAGPCRAAVLSSPLQPRLTTVTPRHPPSPLRAGANTTWWGNYGGGDGSVLLGLPPCDFGPTLTWVGRFTRTVTNTACAATRWSVSRLAPGAAWCRRTCLRRSAACAACCRPEEVGPRRRRRRLPAPWHQAGTAGAAAACCRPIPALPNNS